MRCITWNFFIHITTEDIFMILVSDVPSIVLQLIGQQHRGSEVISPCYTCFQEYLLVFCIFLSFAFFALMQNYNAYYRKTT